jgi:hypothetical protein
MSQKPMGLCPFCKEPVKADVVEENVVRRDKCACPSCGGTIYVCRSPGCDNYAKGGDYYDDEMCPSCTSGAGGTAVGVVAAVAVGVLTGLVTDLFKKNS